MSLGAEDVRLHAWTRGGCGSKGVHGTNGDASERRRRRHNEVEAGTGEDRTQWGWRAHVSNGECWADACEQRRLASEVARGWEVCA